MESAKQDSDLFVSNDGGESTALSALAGTTALPTNETERSVRRRFVYYLGVGSNVGDRFDNIQRAIRLLEDSALVADAGSDIESSSPSPSPSSSSASLRLKVTRTSFLYETPPMYLSEQPHFLNAAIRVEADMEAEVSQGSAEDSGSFPPLLLLRHIKRVERVLGRELQNSPFYVRNGPRPIDLDVLMGHYLRDEEDDPLDGQDSQQQRQIHHPIVFDTETLTVPHPRIRERRFVLVPLEEVAGREYRHPTLGATIGEILRDPAVNREATANDETRVLPLPRQRFLHLNRTLLMGILNVTPDSFSDGNKYNASVDEAALQALALARDGADIVDVGGESTRPGAAPVGDEDELSRVIPVIRRIRSLDPNLPISIDTRNSRVAREAVEAGADIVNDVSAGRHDPDMLRIVADLGVPMVLMHMRGTPETMRSKASYDESLGGVVAEVSRELEEQCQAAEAAGIHRWMQIVDPGIGFAKTLPQNLQLLKRLDHLRSTTGNLPILLGTSRKGFIGSLTGVAGPSDRDPGTIASVVASLCLDPTPNACNIVRVHNVAACKQAILTMDSIRYGQ